MHMCPHNRKTGTHLHPSAASTVQQQHSVMHNLIRQPQLPSLLQDAANQRPALLQERHAHVVQCQVVAGLKPTHCIKGRLAVLLRAQLELLHCTALL